MRNLAAGVSAAVSDGDVHAVRITTQREKDKFFLANDKFIAAPAGSAFVLKFRAKNDIAAKGGARAGVQFLTKDGKRAPIPKHTVLTNCGGSKEWRDYMCKFTVPEGADGFKVVACVYLAKGTAEFTAFQLQNDKAEAVELPNGDCTKPPVAVPSKTDASKRASGIKAAEPNFPVPEDAVWSYSFKVGNDTNSFHITGVTLDAELVQFDGPESLRYLTGRGSARSAKAMPYHLASPAGSSFWIFCNLDRREQVCVWSEERIPLAGENKKVDFAIPFTRNFQDWYSSFAKGAFALRGHLYFQVLDGKKLVTLARQKAVDAQVSPEASFFGSGRTRGNQPLRAGLFTLADLSKFKVEIVDFRSSGKAEGEFAFRIRLTDAAGEVFPVNRVQSLAVTGDGRELVCAAQVDRYDIPTGWFVGKFGSALPKEIRIASRMRASTRDGVKPVAAEAVFSGAATKEGVPCIKKQFCVKPGEIRAVMLYAPILPTGAVEGEAAARALVAKLKKDHYTELLTFAFGNRCWAHAQFDTPYMKNPFAFDLFKVLREETRKAGLMFTAVVCLLTEGAEKPMGFLAEHPEYAMTDGKGGKRGWLDPAVPEVRAYRVRDIVAVAKKYQLDGIQLDYARLAAGPSDRGAELYKAEFGKDPRTFVSGSEDYRRWYKWESEQLTRLVREIRTALDRECPGIDLSAYVQGYRYNGDRVWQEMHQPFGDWLKEGLMNRIFPTGYVYDMLRYECWIKRQIEYCRRHNPAVPIGITIGVGSSHGKILDLEELVDQIDTANRFGADGALFFHWKSLSEFSDGLAETRYHTPSSGQKLRK